MTFRIFLSSPGDCAEERAAAHEISSRLNADPLVASFTQVEIIAWDWGAGVPLEALASPQSSVNHHLTLPEDCDLFVGIFRCKLGTPLPVREFGKKMNGTPFQSGSEYEFHRAWDARRRGACRPEILIYRLRQADDIVCPESDQLEILQAFFDRPPFREEGQWIGSLNWYLNPSEFANQLEGHLRKLLSQRQPGGHQHIDEWLKHHASSLSANAGPRYTQNAHVETDIGQVFDWLLARQSAVAALDKALKEVWETINREPAFDEIKRNMELIAESLRNDIFWQAPPDFSFIHETLNRLQALAWAEHDAHEKADDETRKTDTWRYRNANLQRSAFRAEDTADLLKRYAQLTGKRVLLLTGSAGQGKTHTLVHEIKRTLDMGGMAVGVLGQMLSSSDDLWAAIRNRLEWQGSTGQLLDKLENEAANRKQRALIVIDALNETPDRKRWSSELPAMVREVLRRPHLVLALSVRSDYLHHVLPVLAEGEDTPWVKWEHPGFAGIEPDALMRYFEFFDVKAPVAPPLGEFSNPLYVQLLAKSLKGRQFTHWLPSWLEVWQTWMERLEQEAREKLGLDDPSRPAPIRRIMNKLAQAMLDNGTFTVSRQSADEIAGQTAGVDHVIQFLCSAGALIDRLGDEEDEVVEFGFERLSDTFLADRLLSNLFKGLSSQGDKHTALSQALAPSGSLHPLVSTQWIEHPLHHRRAGLLEALCLAAPKQIGAELPTLIPEDPDQWPDWELSEAFNDSLRWRNRPDEFGGNARTVFELWQQRSRHQSQAAELDELIRFAMIPGHPFSMERVIHPWLVDQDSPGARDAIWSIHLVPLWSDEHSNLRQLVLWARNAVLNGIHPEIALPAAQLLAWICAASQNALRQAAIQGLTRLLVACPSILDEFLPEFLDVNDAYVLEAVLVGVWGVTLGGRSPELAAQAARRVYESQFPNGNPRWCHINLRHYARRIVEEAHCRGWLVNVDLNAVSPPYRSALPLDKVPDKEDLKALDDSNGYRRIVFSSTDWDFYRYEMGGNSASLAFSCQPLPGSPEPVRPFLRSENVISRGTNEAIFDLALAARFVAWNCLSLGWTGKRFEEFDTGYYTREDGRINRDGRTERIGKKYQWISWHTFLGFLADNYAMRPDWNGEPRYYDTPDQTDEYLQDPARWLQVVGPAKKHESADKFWRIPSMPRWPLPDLAAMRKWVRSPSDDLLPADVMACCPELPKDWGEGPWLRLAFFHHWESRFAPGQWGLGNDFYADLWWRALPMLIHTDKLPCLLQQLEIAEVQEQLTEISSVDPPEDWHTPLSQWPTLKVSWDEGFREPVLDVWRHFWLPFPWRPLIAEYRRSEQAPVPIPMPSLFQEWNLDLDVRRGLVLCQGEPIFGLGGWVHGEDVLFASIKPLLKLLAASGYTLVWWLRGERRAFVNITAPNPNTSAWADYHGVVYLGHNGRVETAWLQKEVRN